VDAFDADALIYATADDNPLGDRVRRLFRRSSDGPVGFGSTLLTIELLVKPTRLKDTGSIARLARLLTQLTLYDATIQVTDLAVELGARYRLKTVDAVHLATAVLVGADRFITNNRRDFRKEIAEVDVTYPDELPAA
jgi:predicted nucleic acid-binding protein